MSSRIGWMAIVTISLLHSAEGDEGTTRPPAPEIILKKNAENQLLQLQAFKLKDFDKNSDGKIDMSDFDADGNGAVNKEEIEAIFGPLNRGEQPWKDGGIDPITNKQRDEDLKHSAKEHVTLQLRPHVVETLDKTDYVAKSDFDEIVANKYVGQESVPKKLPWDLKIRKESSGKISDLADIAEAKPALIQFARDFDKDTDIWTVNMALYKVIDFSPSLLKTSNVTTSILPTLTWDRVSGKGDADPKDKNVNLIGGKIGASILNYKPGKAAHELRAFIGYAQDEETGSKLASLEAFWEVFYQPWGVGGFHTPINSPFRYKIDAVLGITGRKVSEAGSDVDLAKHRRNFWFSPRIGFSVSPVAEGWRKLTLHVSYDWDSVIKGNIAKSELFQAGISGALDPDENFSVEFTYSKGDATLVKKSTETLQLGVGLKY